MSDRFEITVPEGGDVTAFLETVVDPRTHAVSLIHRQTAFEWIVDPCGAYVGEHASVTKESGDGSSVASWIIETRSHVETIDVDNTADGVVVDIEFTPKA